jgi:enoyl-CoA hydratase/carnithine racemase
MDGFAALIRFGGLGLDVIAFDDGSCPVASPQGGAVRLGVHRKGPLPRNGLNGFDILLSTDPLAQRPWVGLDPAALQAAVEQLGAAVQRQPVAAAVAAQTMRMAQQLPFEQALVLESLSYSMLLASAEFQRWRSSTPVKERPRDTAARVKMSRHNGKLHITLTRSQSRNAFDAAMRDALVEALEFALVDPDQMPVVMNGDGPSFCAGGDLNEFGCALDPGVAHAIRILQSPVRLVDAIGDRLSLRVHGACIGAGIEIPAAAARVAAAPGTFFRLPEVAMGLIPGAGGTASISRRIGRHRACYMAISGCDIDTATALDWGLIDEMDPGP